LLFSDWDFLLKNGIGMWIVIWDGFGQGVFGRHDKGVRVDRAHQGTWDTLGVSGNGKPLGKETGKGYIWY